MIHRLFFVLVAIFVINISAIAQGFGEKHLINEQWFFHLGDVKYGGRETMDCSEWSTVDVPHDWSVKQNASPELASCTGFLPGGIAWYRKNITIPEVKKGEKVYVYFEGVYNNSEVFINGKWLGKRPNGYISFMYELTPYIKWGEENSIAVRVDHSNDADSRWYTGSGIYRDVYLVYANPIHINQWGVNYQTKVKGNQAIIETSTTINNSLKSTSLKVIQELFDSEGNVVTSSSKSGVVETQTTTEILQTVPLRSPKLWSVKTPYLYTLKTTIVKGSKILDQSETKVGVRTIDFNADKGFSLNGENMKLKGVCLHHDAGVLGAAVYKSVWRSRLQQLKSLGCNAIRTSHNPQAPHLYELCDELGFLVMDEAFDEWEYPKNKWIEGWNRGTPGHQGTSQYFREWSEKDLKDQVMRDRNHPSIIMWSIGNEVDYPNDPYTHPILEEEGIGQQHIRKYLKDHPNAKRLGEIAKELVAVVKEVDTSRPVTAALAGAVMSNFTDYPFVLDVVGYNYTEYKYDMDHEKYPKRILYGSENRHDLPAWHAVRDKDFIFGQFLWTGFDYLGESGPWPSRGFTTGLIDLAGNIKPRGYFRKSLWAESPMVYVGTYKPHNDWLSMDAPKVWNYEADEKVRVVSYTNCEEAELYLNGKIIGARKAYDDETGIIYWDVNYEQGELRVVAYNNNKEVVTDSIITNTYPVKLSAVVIEASDDDVRQIVVKILDKDGNQVVMADNELTCSVEGGVLLGMENASNDVSLNYHDNKQRCINGQLLLFLKRKEVNKEMLVKITSPLLEGIELNL